MFIFEIRYKRWVYRRGELLLVAKWLAQSFRFKSNRELRIVLIKRAHTLVFHNIVWIGWHARTNLCWHLLHALFHVFGLTDTNVSQAVYLLACQRQFLRARFSIVAPLCRLAQYNCGFNKRVSQN
ncbi:Endoribonuclease YbeY [Candidatus Hodgkinia cicadicola]|nr:Endoribonuclease YbeY [Candidatus Hodgkinia cicadicola]